MPIILDDDFSIDLCTLDQVRGHDSYQDSDHEHDEVIPDLITAMSRHLLKIREFRPAMAATARTFEVDRCDGPVFHIDPWDLQSASSVTLDVGHATEQLLDATDQWRLTSYWHESQTFGAIEIPTPLSDSGFSRSMLTVEGVWGFPSVPEDVREACILAVILHLRSEVQAFGSAYQPNSLGDGVNQPSALPPGIRGLVSHWEREVYA